MYNVGLYVCTYKRVGYKKMGNRDRISEQLLYAYVGLRYTIQLDKKIVLLKFEIQLSQILYYSAVKKVGFYDASRHKAPCLLFCSCFKSGFISI